MKVIYSDIKPYIGVINVTPLPNGNLDLCGSIFEARGHTCKHCQFLLEGSRCALDSIDNPHILQLVSLLETKHPELFI